MWFLLPPSLVSVAQFSSPNRIRYGWFWWPLDWPSKADQGGFEPLTPKSKIRNPKSVNPKSRIQNPKSKLFWPDFGDFGFWIVMVQIVDFGAGFWILGFGFWILDFGFWILDFWALSSSSFCADFGFWTLDFGFGTKFWMLHKIRILSTQTRVGGYYYVHRYMYK